MQAMEIAAAGMVTAVGHTSAACAAAIRCAIDNFSETRFMDAGGDWIVGSPVALDGAWQGLPKLARMASLAIRECLAAANGAPPETIPLLLCIAERERPGRIEDLDDELLAAIQADAGIRFHPLSAVIPGGRVAGGLALLMARELMRSERLPFCLVAGADSLLAAATLDAYERRHRLLTSNNSNGFIPGEAGAAVLVSPLRRDAHCDLICRGIGLGQEAAVVDSEEPLRADGLVQAFRAAFADAGCGFESVHYRLCDANGEQYWFKEAALALTRTLRVRREQFDIWHPADCIGEVGAAAVPCALAVALAAARKKYAPGPGAICHCSGEGPQRAAMILSEGSAAA